MSKSLPPMAATVLETALNGYLRLNPDSEAILSGLSGQSIRVQLTDPALSIDVLPGPGGVRVLETADVMADVTIRATLSGLIRMARSEPGAERGLHIEGELAAARELQRAVGELQLDWEALLGAVVGELPGHLLARVIHTGISYGRRTSNHVAADLAEYLQYEIDALTPKIRVQQFVREVDELRNAADRLEARVRRLEQQQ